MRGCGPFGEVLDVVGRLGHSAGPAPAGSGTIGHWLVTLASCLAVLAVGGVAARVVHRLTRRSDPELAVLLDRSAAFYARWPEHRLASAPPAELAAEAARCRRIIELVETGTPADRPGRTGAIDGLRAWIALLRNVIESGTGTLPGPAYA